MRELPKTSDLLPLPILQGERCLLRPLAAADAASLQRHADNPNVARCMFDGFPSPYTPAIAQEWCEREAHSGAWGYVWGIVARADANDAVVGCIGLVPDAGWTRCNAELGYWIGESHWRRGLASDAVRQVADWALAATPELTRIFAAVFASNEGSQAVVRKCGFVREGLLRQSAIKDGKVIDRVLWAAYRPAADARPANIDLALAMTAATAMERA
jgi:RimJ/RimL family protein N-acetyltransferase